MGNKLLTGVSHTTIGVPSFLWEKQIEQKKHKISQSTQFMSLEHRRIHHFVVREMPRAGGPIPPEMVARELDIPLERTREILQDLEEHMTFLVKNNQGQVIWAYPVTVEKTPHAITFGSGEQLYAA